MHTMRFLSGSLLVTVWAFASIAHAQDTPRLRISWDANTLAIEAADGEPALPGRKLTVN